MGRGAWHRSSMGWALVYLSAASAAVPADDLRGMSYFKSGRYSEAAAEFQSLVDEKNGRAAAGRAGLIEKGEDLVEGFARRCRRALGHPRERRCRRDGLKKPLWRRRRPLDVDVLTRRAAEAIAQRVQQVGAARAAAAQQDGDP